MADTIKLFGRSYNQIGSSDADMIIKTRGQLKLQYGSKFIDLIKDGKLNVNTDFIFKVKALENVTGRDGLYITDDGSIYLKIGDSVINLVGEVGTTYVAFLEPQETTSDQKHQALVNIGFLHENLDSIDQNSLRNGIVYVESEQKLYTIVDGTISELIVSFPNPFTSQFIVAKTSSDKGAILIKGSGIENSLAFESLFIYTDKYGSNIDSDENILFNIGGQQVLSLSAIQALFSNPVVSSMFKSPNATNSTGFRLYIEGGQSFLEVDNLIVRKSEDDSSIHLFPEYWLLKNNIISEASLSGISDEDEDNETSQEESLLTSSEITLELQQDNEFVVGDIVVFYKKSEGSISIGTQEVEVYDEETGEAIGTETQEQFKEIETFSRVEAEVTEITDESITVRCSSTELSEEDISLLGGQFVYLIKTSDDLPIRLKDNNIDIVEYGEDKDESGNRIPEIKTRIGNLSELNIQESSKGNPSDIKEHGIYSEHAYFKQAGYTSNYDLPDGDDSTRIPSTEWVRKLINSIIPKGTIVAYHGDDLPDGWWWCNGEKGTPDLRNKFIRAGMSEEEGGNNEVMLDVHNIPSMDSSPIITTNAGTYSGKKIPVLDKVEEFVFNEGESSHYCVYTGYKEGDNGLTSIEVNNLDSLLSLSGTVGVPTDLQHPIKIEPKYYQLVFIMKIE